MVLAVIMRKAISHSKMADHMKPRYFIKSVVKALAALEYISRSGKPQNLKDIASAVGIPAGSAIRYVRTLLDMGYVDQDPITRKYHLSTQAFKLGAHLLGAMNLRSRILPYMVDMTDKWNVTSQCAILDGTEIVYIERIKALDVVNLDLAVGSHLPVDCTALGRAILAFSEPDQVKELINRIEFIPHTPHTIINKTAFKKELARTRERGYAVNTEELALGLETLAAPVFHGDRVEAAYGVSYPIYRFDNQEQKEPLTKEMLEVASLVSLH
jgi:DNA-binding IclR family transcriptional regulator